METGLVKTCDFLPKAKYHPTTDIIKFQRLGVKVSNAIMNIFRVAGTTV
jgi:hypothetical protein